MNRSGTRRGTRYVVLLSFCVFAVAVFTGLGLWQLERRVWKLDLIDRVNQRVHAGAVAAPGVKDWPSINAKDDAYRHVTVSGYFLNDRETLVQAVTERGPGFWVMTPLRKSDGTTILINRGFVPPDRRDPATRRAGQIAAAVTITGLLRMSEPKGGFLRANKPESGFWYSRDVAAISAARQMTRTAPYFIDAGSAPVAGGLPVGGLTVIGFHNNHLVYATSWFAMALMACTGLIVLLRNRGA